MDDAVAKALHAVRHHLAGGGFLSDLFSGPDYQSTGEKVVDDGRVNWGNPDSASDFFRADKALRLAREVQANEEPALTASRPGAVETRELPPPSAPLAFAPEPEKNPARAAIDEATKLTGRAPQGPELSARDRDLIIRTIAAETSGKSPEESQAIAHVILNRIQSGQYGASPEAVLLAKKQFEPWSNPAGANYPMRFTPESRRYGMGQTALDAALGAEDITGGATNFWAPKAQAALGRRPPEWGRTGGMDIGETRFHKLERAEGGEVEGYAGGGDVIAKALAALRGGNKVFPKPQRMFPEGARPPGGEYINAATGEAMTGQKPARAVIGVTPEGKPVFLADPEQVDVTGSPGKGSTKTKTNLFKQQAGWKWNEAPEGYENVPTIVSAENRGQHYYGLGADFPKGVDLERYANAPSEPRLRPTTQGNVYPGEQVGLIDVRGREHPVYDMLTIRNLLTGTGAGAAGAAAMPEDIPHEAHGGLVDDALHVVREHHADGEAVGQGPVATDNSERVRAAESAANLAKQIQAYEASMESIRQQPKWQEMSHAPEKPRAPISVEALGKNREFGSAPYDVAGPLSSFAQGAYDMKTLPLYMYPPTAPLGMAIDTAEGVASGSPTQVAMGALGGPLKVARNVIAPLAVATGVTAPDEAEAGALQKAINSIRAYHSSPHEFSRFDLSKIGTGEGNQSFGHGLYFAENPSVSGRGGDYWRQFFNKMKPGVEQSAAGSMFANKFERDRAIEALLRSHEYSAARAVPGKYGEGPDVELGHKLLADQYAKAAEFLKSGQIAGPRTYEVEIHADPTKFLNYDRPLNEQSQSVQKSLRSMDIADPSAWPNIKGNDAYEMLRVDSMGDDAFLRDRDYRLARRAEAGVGASKMLNEAGIPGIRYLDAGSRDLGHGTSNYVIFDDKLIDINRRYAEGGVVDPASVEDRALMLVSKQA